MSTCQPFQSCTKELSSLAGKEKQTNKQTKEIIVIEMLLVFAEDRGRGATEWSFVERGTGLRYIYTRYMFYILLWL